MTAGIGLGQLSGVIHPYPTQARRCATSPIGTGGRG